MAALGLLVCAIIYCIFGSMMIIFPKKTKEKLNGASNSTIRWYGVIVFAAGVLIAAAAVIINGLCVLLLKITE